jgi:hypothetical protein
LCIVLAGFIVNSIPRGQLKGHSPYFLTFLREPFSELTWNSECLELDNYFKSSLNDRNFTYLLRELLLKCRKANRKARKLKFQSYPPGSIVYLKDFSYRPFKKTKPKYLKSPLRVVAEFHSIVYLENFSGQVKRASKNNLRPANERSVYLFGSLPLDIQMILGGPLNEDEWQKIKDQDLVPEYLATVDLDEEIQHVTRSVTELPVDTHILESSEDLSDHYKFDHDYQELDAFPNEIEDSNLMQKLQVAHKRQLLTAPNMTLNDLEKLCPELDLLPVEDDLNVTAAANEQTMAEMENLQAIGVPKNRTMMGIDEDNIIPGSRSRKQVTFYVASIQKEYDLLEFDGDLYYKNGLVLIDEPFSE